MAKMPADHCSRMGLGKEKFSTLRGTSMVILSRVLPAAVDVPWSKKAEFDMEETLF